jgi:[protein-PII] uridylyltransferase
LTPPQDALAVPVSDRNPRLTVATEPGTLIVPETEIFDTDAVRARIDAACAEAAGAAAVRAAAVSVLQEANARGRAKIAEAFAALPLAARRTTRAYCHLTDCLVREVLRVAETHLHPNPLPSQAERMAVMAVGGYGRGEMAPFSDVDLLFVTPWKMAPAIESVIESTLYMLWDLHMKVGHASRTVKECLRLGRQDITIRTSLLEMRFLCGTEAVGAELQTSLRKQLFDGTVAEFIEAKLAERGTRHRKQGGQRYMLEPNVKEGKGGLRDLQTLYWIAKYEHGVPGGRPGRSRRVPPRGIRRLRRGRAVSLGGALPPAPDRRSRTGPDDLRHPGAGRRTDGLRGPFRPPRRRALHAGLFPPRHPRRRTDPHLPDRARGAPCQAGARDPRLPARAGHGARR